MSTTRREFLRDGSAAVAALSVGGSIGALPASAARTPAFALGFKSLREETRLPDLPLEGRMPKWLTGTLQRNGPALFEVGPDRLQPLVRWPRDAARVLVQRRKSLSTRIASCARARTRPGNGRSLIRYSEFGTDPCRKIFSGVSTLPVLGRVPNANVSLERLGRRFCSAHEIPVPVRFDPRTLRDARGRKRRPPPPRPTRHRPPASRPAHRGAVQLRDRAGPTQRPADPLGAEGASAASWRGYPTARPGTSTHSHSRRDTWPSSPSRSTSTCPGSCAPTGARSSPTTTWEASKPSRILIIDRQRGGVVSTVELEPFFVFHHVNAFEHKGQGGARRLRPP